MNLQEICKQKGLKVHQLAHLFISICFASSVFSQVPNNLKEDSLMTDTISVVHPDSIETDAMFKGGYGKMAKFIVKNLRQEEVQQWTEQRKQPLKNRVVVKFTVEPDGSLTNIHVDSATEYCPPCNREVIRLVKSMPKWKPAKKGKKRVRNWVRIPIVFDFEYPASY